MEPLSLYGPGDIQKMFSKKIRNVRKSMGYTQAEVARRSGVPLSTYARFEQSGEISLRHLCAVLVTLRREHEIEGILNVESKAAPTPMERIRKNKKSMKG